jgi:hypothetical protein
VPTGILEAAGASGAKRSLQVWWTGVLGSARQLKSSACMQFMPLPTLMFSGGHSYFIQHLAERFNTTPFYAHACLVPGHVPGKVARFKEHNLWAIEHDSYYTSGQFLYYENTVQAFIAKLEQVAGQVRFYSTGLAHSGRF